MTLKTPILSVLIAALTFFIVFSIAGGIMVSQYHRSEAKLQASDVVYTELEKDFKYDKDIKYAYLYLGDESESIKCSFLYEIADNNAVILYFKPERSILKEEETDMYIDIIQKRISLARRMLGDYTN